MEEQSLRPIPPIEQNTLEVEKTIDELESKKVGRPTLYTTIIGNYICSEIATTTKSNQQIVDELGLNMKTFFNWLKDQPEFLQGYQIAKNLQANLFADEVIDIADEEIGFKDMAAAARNKLRVEARRWRAERQAPKVWGERKEEPTNPDQIQPMTDDQFSRFMELQKKRALELKQETDTPSDGDFIPYEESK